MANLFVNKELDKNKTIMDKEMGINVSFDMGVREVFVLQKRVNLFYINGLTDDSTVVELLKELVNVNDNESETDEIAEIIENRLVNQQVDKETKWEKIFDELLSGLIVVFVDSVRHAYIIDVRKYPGRPPEEPDTERVIRGSRDGFTENIIENTALIRRRIKDRKLINEVMTVGKRSKTTISVCYVKDIANEHILEMVKKRINDIDIEGLVMADKALAELFFHTTANPFPIVRFTERPDVAAQNIINGYIILVVDTSPNAIILPTTFFDHLEHAEEYRQTPAVGTFVRWIRILAVLSSIFLLPFWLIFILEPSMLPHALSFIGLKETSNIPIALQIILADAGVEFLRMAAVHTPTPLATALGLIAAVLVGDIAIKVGLFSPEVILYVAISTIGSYVTPSYELSVANKILKSFLLLMTIFFGGTGFIIGCTIGFIYLVRIKSVHTPYLWPVVPFDLRGFLKFIIRMPVSAKKYRPEIVLAKDKTVQ